MTYPFKSIETKWRKRFDDTKIDHIGDFAKNPYYVLEMLPYPSGKIHMGHVRNYTIGDAMARFLTSKGYSVLHPMGWDAFGLPAENAAMERGEHPKKWTYCNIESMKKQLEPLGFSYDWSREVATCDVSYYAIEQKIFQDMYDRGLIYKKESWVNFDPVEGSVLANEQVINGRGWRSGAVVERRKLSQWSVKITAYADELLEDLKTLKGWPEKVLKMQENWIGKSTGAIVHFAVDGMEEAVIDVFTTRPDTLFGASFIAISAHHPFVSTIRNDDVDSFVAMCDQIGTTEEALSTITKKGYETGYYCMHPLDPHKKLPIYIANFVVMDYGTGALFGCPAHDERDHEFATLYNLPIIPVVRPIDASSHDASMPYTQKDGILIHSQFLDGLHVDEAILRTIQELEKNGKGKAHVQYRLRDWLVSRQRYWGCPIPMIYCPHCGIVKADDVVVLPEDVDFSKPGNPLERHPTWKYVNCPRCAADAVRETDTLDTFFESSWYFLRYCCPHDATLDKAKCAHFAPVNLYIGGIEHAVLHLLYARFFVKALRDMGYIDLDEPFENLLTQGMVCHPTYQTEGGTWLAPDEVIRKDGTYVHTQTLQPVIVGRCEKMSKSKKNVIDPGKLIEIYGADCVRLFILSDTPPEKDFDWNEEGIEGCSRYLARLDRLFASILASTNDNAPKCPHQEEQEFLSRVHKLAYEIHANYEKILLNKVVANCRELTNTIDEAQQKGVSKQLLTGALEFLLFGLYPIIPHITHELYETLGYSTLLAKESWKKWDDAYLTTQTLTYAVQVNGKLRGTLNCDVSLSQKEIEALCFDLPGASQYLQGKALKRVVFVEGKLINFVV